MTTFQREFLKDVREECKDIIRMHWREIALDQDTIPLNPCWYTYDILESADQLLIVTARNDERILIGYSVYLVSQALHYKDLKMAESDIFYLHPAYRRTTFEGLPLGKVLIKKAEGFLLDLGVQKIFSNVKNHKNVGPVFESMGYAPIETRYVKRLG